MVMVRVKVKVISYTDEPSRGETLIYFSMYMANKTIKELIEENKIIGVKRYPNEIVAILEKAQAYHEEQIRQTDIILEQVVKIKDKEISELGTQAVTQAVTPPDFISKADVKKAIKNIDTYNFMEGELDRVDKEYGNDGDFIKKEDLLKELCIEEKEIDVKEKRYVL